MKITITLTLCLALILGIMGAEQKECNDKCSREYDPLCAVLNTADGETLECTFPNECVFNFRACQANETWTVTRARGGCSNWNEECMKLFQ